MAINSSHAIWRGFNLWKETYLDCKIFSTIPRKWKCLTTPCADFSSCFQSSALTPLHSLKLQWIEECQEPSSPCLHLVWAVKCFTFSECLVCSFSLQRIVEKLRDFSLTSSTFIFSWSLLQIRPVFPSLTSSQTVRIVSLYWGVFLHVYLSIDRSERNEDLWKLFKCTVSLLFMKVALKNRYYLLRKLKGKRHPI